MYVLELLIVDESLMVVDLIKYLLETDFDLPGPDGVTMDTVSRLSDWLKNGVTEIVVSGYGMSDE